MEWKTLNDPNPEWGDFLIVEIAEGVLYRGDYVLGQYTHDFFERYNPLGSPGAPQKRIPRERIVRWACINRDLERH